MADLEKEVEAIILQGLGEGGDTSTTQDQQPQEDTTTETGERKVIDLDMFRLRNGGLLFLPSHTTPPLDAQIVESEAPPPETISQTPTIPLTPAELETEIPQPALIQHRRIPAYVLYSLLFLFLLSAGALSYLFILPLTATATVTLTPLTRTLQKEATLTIAASPTKGAVQGRVIQSVSLTKSETVAATGRGHNDARAATGVITFYNADSQSYTIPAGVSFTVNTITIVTDQAVTVQAAIPPVFGQAITPAHAVSTGAAGNIPAGSINTRCCGSEFITATNTAAFTGGQDEKNYTYIQTSDIRSASQDLLTSVTPQVTSALTKQLHPGEALVTPLCSPRTTSSGQPGGEALTVTVSVTQTCQSVAYLTDSLNFVATSILSHAANLASYQQVGTVQVTINGSTFQQHTATLKVSLSGLWMYRFSQQVQTYLKHAIAGLSKDKAQALLESQPGIQGVTIHVSRLDFKNQLPTDVTHIHLVFFVIAQP